jgi:hypothetical protein
MKFRLSQKPGVIDQIRALDDLAKARGIRRLYAETLQEIVRHLQTHPLDWGDPEYRLRHEGAVVCHRIVDPLIVRFAVYEIEERVHILEITPLSTSLLGDS